MADFQKDRDVEGSLSGADLTKPEREIPPLPRPQPSSCFDDLKQPGMKDSLGNVYLPVDTLPQYRISGPNSILIGIVSKDLVTALKKIDCLLQETPQPTDLTLVTRETENFIKELSATPEYNLRPKALEGMLAHLELLFKKADPTFSESTSPYSSAYNELVQALQKKLEEIKL